MTPGDLDGAVFGPTTVSVSAERVADFVAATGDETARWIDFAPPGFGAVLLFAVAGDFLWDPRIAEHTRTLLHRDQSFTYAAPVPVGEELTVTGRVVKARERSGSFFVTFEADAAAGGKPVMRSSSTFVMSSQATGDPGPDIREPGVTAKADDERPVRISPVMGPLPPLHKSASRSDLVRYAATTKDFNPIHWDHEAARAGGAPGIIVHGLLMLSWALQAVAVIGNDQDPVAHVAVRFRNALRPAEQATVTASAGAVAGDGCDAEVALAVRRRDHELVTGTATVRTSRG